MSRATLRWRISSVMNEIWLGSGEANNATATCHRSAPLKYPARSMTVEFGREWSIWIDPSKVRMSMIGRKTYVRAPSPHSISASTRFDAIMSACSPMRSEML